MQRNQKARVAFHSSDVRGCPSICFHRHEVGKRQTAKTVAISLKCSIVCRTQHIDELIDAHIREAMDDVQHIFHGCPMRAAFVHAVSAAPGRWGRPL
jgi:hypothetical protein